MLCSRDDNAFFCNGSEWHRFGLLGSSKRLPHVLQRAGKTFILDIAAIIGTTLNKKDRSWLWANT
jgi:hypothetical protein